MENVKEITVEAVNEVPTVQPMNINTVSQAQIVANHSLTDTQRKALQRYAIINNVALRGDYNATDNTFDNVADCYKTDSNGVYERDILRVTLTLVGDDEPIKTQMNSSDLNGKSLVDLQGCFVKVKTKAVVEGEPLPFKKSKDKEFKKATTSFTWAKDFNVLTNKALAMILATS